MYILIYSQLCMSINRTKLETDIQSKLVSAESYKSGAITELSNCISTALECGSFDVAADAAMELCNLHSLDNAEEASALLALSISCAARSYAVRIFEDFALSTRYFFIFFMSLREDLFCLFIIYLFMI